MTSIIKEISIEGKERIGGTMLGDMYRLDDKNVVKIFSPKASYNLFIEQDNVNARNALAAGIPAAISYEVVRVGNRLGKIYVMNDCHNLVDLILNDKDHMDDYIRRLAEAVRKIHSIRVSPSVFRSERQHWLNNINENKISLTPDEKDKLVAIFEDIPETDTFLHGMCYIGNVIVQNDEYLFIDLGNAAMGDPLFDLTPMYSLFRNHGKYATPEARKGLLSKFTYEEALRIWNVFISSYLGTEDHAMIVAKEKQIRTLDLAMRLYSHLTVPGILSERNIEDIKEELFE